MRSNKQPKMSKQDRQVHNIIKNVRRKVYTVAEISHYDKTFMEAYVDRELKVNKEFYDKTWNIKVKDTITHRDRDIETYFLMELYSKTPEEEFDWIQKDLTTLHLDAMFQENPRDTHILFKSKVVEISANLKEQIVYLNAKGKIYRRNYKLEELTLFKNTVEMIKNKRKC